ncbi:Polarized growth protein Scy OS=Streptomyces alboniger OX=132473 GN=CP975_24655 PE=4 SV=1 [Streptomyces alboniger]
MRRREDINAEISRVQDVLEALESFEAPGAGKDGVKAGAVIGAPRSGWQVVRGLEHRVDSGTFWGL